MTATIEKARKETIKKLGKARDKAIAKLYAHVFDQKERNKGYFAIYEGYHKAVKEVNDYKGHI